MDKTTELKNQLITCQNNIEDTERKLYVITDGEQRDTLLLKLSNLYDERTILKLQIKDN